MHFILIADEHIEDYRHSKQRVMILKLDLEKACEYTTWDFLDYMMARNGLGVDEGHGYMVA